MDVRPAKPADFAQVASNLRQEDLDAIRAWMGFGDCTPQEILTCLQNHAIETVAITDGPAVALFGETELGFVWFMSTVEEFPPETLKVIRMWFRAMSWHRAPHTMHTFVSEKNKLHRHWFKETNWRGIGSAHVGGQKFQLLRHHP
jgi:hypothetical protein